MDEFREEFEPEFPFPVEMGILNMDETPFITGVSVHYGSVVILEHDHDDGEHIEEHEDEMLVFDFYLNGSESEFKRYFVHVDSNVGQLFLTDAMKDYCQDRINAHRE